MIKAQLHDGITLEEIINRFDFFESVNIHFHTAALSSIEDVSLNQLKECMEKSYPFVLTLFYQKEITEYDIEWVGKKQVYYENAYAQYKIFNKSIINASADFREKDYDALREEIELTPKIIRLMLTPKTEYYVLTPDVLEYNPFDFGEDEQREYDTFIGLYEYDNLISTKQSFVLKTKHSFDIGYKSDYYFYECIMIRYTNDGKLDVSISSREYAYDFVGDDLNEFELNQIKINELINLT